MTLICFSFLSKLLAGTKYCYFIYLWLNCRYRLAYSSNYSHILDPLIENNYQLFMIERLIMMGGKTFIRTFKEDETDLSLTDDPKKNTKLWQIPVYNVDETCWRTRPNMLQFLRNTHEIKETSIPEIFRKKFLQWKMRGDWLVCVVNYDVSYSQDFINSLNVCTCLIEKLKWTINF